MSSDDQKQAAAERAAAMVEDGMVVGLGTGTTAERAVRAIGRRVKKPWRLGEYVVPAETAVAMSILALHHREDVYPEPHAFRPERFLGRKPGTYTWIPFGGGIRRCLGATGGSTARQLSPGFAL